MTRSDNLLRRMLKELAQAVGLVDTPAEAVARRTSLERHPGWEARGTSIRCWKMVGQTRMTRLFKSTMLVIAGLGWLAFALLFGVLLYLYLVGGAGLQVFGFFLPVSSTTVGFGLIHFIGFAAAASLCFLIGAGLFACGLAPLPERSDQKGCSSDETNDG